jgi:hypothetical protein
MWQFTVMWGLIPGSITHWIINLMLLVGIVGILASWIGRWIPFFNNYVRILKPVGILLFVGGVYLKGGEQVDLAWKARVAELEAKIAVTEKKSKDYNKKLDSVIKEKNNAIKEKDRAIKNRITVVKDQIDRECTVDSEAVKILNDSAKQPKVKK